MRRRRNGDGDDRGAPLLRLRIEDVDSAGLERVLRETDRLVLVEFWSAGCEPCRELRPQLERLAAEHADLCRVVAVDAGAEPEAVGRHRVRAAPTLIFFRSGRELRRFRGGALPANTMALLAGSA